MTWLAIKALLRGWFKRLFEFILSHPWQAAVAVLIVTAWWQHSTVTGLRKDLVAIERARDAEKAAHQQTVANYREASDLAQKAAKANVERVKKEQAAITERIKDDYQTRMAATDARYRRLLASSRADQGNSGSAGMSGTGSTSCTAYGAACTDELLAVLKDAEDNTNRLVSLQDWVRQQATIKTNH